jgi:hypothetical protein
VTGPQDPEDDWGFPEVDPAGPASTRLPPPEPEPPAAYDTGSDAWWRAQAQAQRAAAQGEPAVPPSPPPAVEEPEAPELVEAEVLRPEPEPSPLDSGWIPPELPELRAPEPEPEPAADAEPDQVAEAWPDVADAQAPDEAPPAEDPPIWVAPSFEDAPRARTPAQPDRVGPARAVAGALLAVAGVGLGIGALLLIDGDEPKGTPTVALPTVSAGPTASTTTSPTPEPTATTTTPVVVPSAPPAAAPIVPVTVLNNSRVSRLADRWAARFRAGGWPVPVTGNYRGGTIRATTVYYPPGLQASAQRFATQFGVDRVLPRFAGLPGDGVTVVLTRDFA